MTAPIILCGLGRMGSRVLEYLQTAGLPVVVVDSVCPPGDPRLHGARLVVGDCRRREVLEEAGAASARGVLVLTSDDLLNISCTLLVRTLNPDVRIVLRMFNQNLLARLGKAVNNVFALSTSLLTAPMIAMTALTGQALGSFRLDGAADGRRQVASLTVAATSPLRGRRIVDVTGWRDLIVLAHVPSGASPRWLLDVDLDANLAAGDRIVLCGDPRTLAALLAVGEEGKPGGLLWAGRIRRLARVVRQTVAGIDRPVVVCTLILLAVVAGSTLVLHLGMNRYSLGQALLRTVSIMATASTMHDEEIASDGLRVFVAGLRIVGLALTAAFTAIVTNYLIRARLGGALEISRIPEGGHIVVCGLTPIGFRVVEELTSLGEPVVVVEMDPSNRFVPTVRRLKAAVVIGDAAVSEVLRQAHAGPAKAVVAATNNDMVNLEVALLVREMNPTQRVVLLQTDPNLAQMLREGANVRHAVSVPALAAPAFVAGLFGERVQGLFQVEEKLVVALTVVVQQGDPLVGQSVRAVAVDHRLVVAALQPADGSETLPPRRALAARLAAGDRLTAVLALSDLERLVRRQPSSAAFAVDVFAFPPPARGWVVGLLRTTRTLDLPQAEALLDALPVRFAANLTRGQAEDLLAQLVRERVTAKIVPVELGLADESATA